MESGPSINQISDDLELDVDIFGTGSLGQVEIATGPAFTNWTRVPVDYPVPVQGWGTLCPTTQAGFPTKYFSGNSVVYNTYSAISLLDWAGGPVKIRLARVICRTGGLAAAINSGGTSHRRIVLSKLQERA